MPAPTTDNLFPEIDYSVIEHDFKLDDKWLSNNNQNQQPESGEPQDTASAEEASEYQDTLEKIHEHEHKDIGPKSKENKKDRMERIRKEYEENYIPMVAELQQRVIKGMKEIWETKLKNLGNKSVALVLDRGEYKITVDGTIYKSLKATDLMSASNEMKNVVLEMLETQPAIEETKREHATGEAPWRINPNTQEGGPYATGSTNSTSPTAQVEPTEQPIDVPRTAKLVVAGQGICTWCGKNDDVQEYITEQGQRYLLCPKCLQDNNSVMLTEKREASIQSKLAFLSEGLRTANLHNEAITIEELIDEQYLLEAE
jgi:hypothetical protein